MNLYSDFEFNPEEEVSASGEEDGVALRRLYAKMDEENRRAEASGEASPLATFAKALERQEPPFLFAD